MSPIDTYLEKLTAPQKGEIERVRKIVKQIVPEAEEVFSYGMPGFKYKSEYLIWVGAFKNHMSLFPTTGPIKALKDKLEDFELSKGTIQYKLENPISEALIKEILRSRLAEIVKR